MPEINISNNSIPHLEHEKGHQEIYLRVHTERPKILLGEAAHLCGTPISMSILPISEPGPATFIICISHIVSLERFIFRAKETHSRDGPRCL